MKVLLLNPSVDLDKCYGSLKKFYAPIPSIGLAYIIAVLKKNNISAYILDAYLLNLSVDQIVQEISKAAPDILGISVLTPAMPLVEKIVLKVKSKFPHIKIVMGNIHACVFADELLQKNLCDFIVHQEGEFTFFELVDKISKKDSFENVLGISYKKNDKIFHNKKRPLISNLDELPYPAWDVFPIKKFSPDIRLSPPDKSKSQYQSLPILATRGCPSGCPFCSASSDYGLGRKYRLRNPQNIVNEIEYNIVNYNCRNFYYLDLTFPLKKSHAIDVCNEIIKRKLDISWQCETRVDCVDEEILALMKKAGCFRIDFGIESGNQEILDLIKKRFKLKQAEQAVKLAKKAGLEVEGLFMLGLPTETKEKSWETINFALKLDLDFAKFNLFVPFPGTEFFEMLNKENKVNTSDWGAFTPSPAYSGIEPVYIPDGRSSKELLDTQRKAMRKFFLRPKIILRNLKNLNLAKIDQYISASYSLLKK